MAEERQKKNEAVVKNVKAKDAPKSRTFWQSFVEEDVKTIKDYLIFDVLVPATKNAISDLVSGGVDMLLFGQASGRRRSGGGTNYTAYSSKGNTTTIRYDSNTQQSKPVTRNGVYTYKDIYLGSRADAEEVLTTAIATLEKYEALSVADLYEICGMDSNYTDNKYGWTNLNGACVQRTADGFLIKMPRVEIL